MLAGEAAGVARATRVSAFAIATKEAAESFIPKRGFVRKTDASRVWPVESHERPLGFYTLDKEESGKCDSMENLYRSESHQGGGGSQVETHPSVTHRVQKYRKAQQVSKSTDNAFLRAQ